VDGLNLYVYCGNDPVGHVDFWGLKAWDCCGKCNRHINLRFVFRDRPYFHAKGKKNIQWAHVEKELQRCLRMHGCKTTIRAITVSDPTFPEPNSKMGKRLRGLQGATRGLCNFNVAVARKITAGVRPSLGWSGPWDITMDMEFGGEIAETIIFMHELGRALSYKVWHSDYPDYRGTIPTFTTAQCKQIRQTLKVDK